MKKKTVRRLHSYEDRNYIKRFKGVKFIMKGLSVWIVLDEDSEHLFTVTPRKVTYLGYEVIAFDESYRYMNQAGKNFYLSFKEWFDNYTQWFHDTNSVIPVHTHTNEEGELNRYEYK